MATTQVDPTIRSFAAMLQGLEDGQLLEDLSAKLRELNTKMSRSAEAIGQAKGELTLKLKMTAEQGGTVFIDGVITMKEPTPKRIRTAMWLTKDAHLSAENPKQQKLPLRGLDAPKDPPRDVPQQDAPRG